MSRMGFKFETSGKTNRVKARQNYSSFLVPKLKYYLRISIVDTNKLLLIKLAIESMPLEAIRQLCFVSPYYKQYYNANSHSMWVPQTL
jgi:hypothetical protein